MHLHLHRSLLPVGFWRNLRDDSLVFLVGIRVGRDLSLLRGTKPGEIRLRDIEFDLKIIQVRQGYDRSLRPARRCARKLRRNQFAFFGSAVEDRARNGGTDYRGIKLCLGIIELALRLRQCALGAADLFCAGPDLQQLKYSFQ